MDNHLTLSNIPSALNNASYAECILGISSIILVKLFGEVFWNAKYIAFASGTFGLISFSNQSEMILLLGTIVGVLCFFFFVDIANF